jgi:hypothetical protein
VVALKPRLRGQRIDEREARLGTEGHRDRDCPIQLRDRRWRELDEQLVERGDARPIRVLGGPRSKTEARLEAR